MDVGSIQETTKQTKKMQIVLSKHEVELLDKALQSWEGEATASALTGSIIGTMLSGAENREETNKRVKKELEDAEKESQSRRVKSLLLRAKLYQSLMKESEHNLGTCPSQQ